MQVFRERDHASKRQMAYSAAAMYGGATFLGISQALTAEGPDSSIVPGFFALVVVAALLIRGPRFPTWALASLGPIGAALIASAVATSPGPSDGAVLYIWPVIWIAYFFGRTATLLIVGWIGVVHAIALIELPAASSYLDRWFDVIVPIGVVGVVVNALALRNEELLVAAQADARIDGLTGLMNRRGFDERVPTEIARARRDGVPVAAVSFDIDHFKRVNDTWGHDAGDRVLVRLGEVFRAESREADVIARVGGEEFTALLWNSDRREACRYAERVRVAFAASELGMEPITLSAGIACEEAPELSDVDTLLHEADSALYAAKAGGRDRAVVFKDAHTSLLAR